LGLRFQSFLNTGFFSAVQGDLSFMIGCLLLVTKAARSPSFRNFVPKHYFGGYLLWNTQFILERDHGSDRPSEAIKTSPRAWNAPSACSGGAWESGACLWAAINTKFRAVRNPPAPSVKFVL